MNQNTKEIYVIQPTKSNQHKKKRVAVYARVSTDSFDQSNSFLAQISYYNDYINQHDDMILVDIYADEGISGTSLSKRDEMKRLIKDAKFGKIDLVLVKSVTRFARNSVECIEIIRTMKDNGVYVFFENDNIHTKNMSSEMILYIKSQFAETEALTCSKRMKKSNQMRMENGTFKTATAPYGYKLGKNRLEIIPNEAENVKLIYQLYLSGLGANGIIKRLKEKGKDINLSVGQINYILTNEKYIGDCLFQKSFTPNIIPFKQKQNRGELPKYYYSNTHEAIISKEDFENAQLLRKSRKAKLSNGTKNDTQKYLFNRKIRCRKCKCRYKSRLRNNEVVWICAKKGLANTDCHLPSYTNQEIEKAFIKMFNILKQNQNVILDETILQLQNIHFKMIHGKNEISEIDAELLNLEKQLCEYSELYLCQIIDELCYIEKTDEIKNRTSELRRNRLKMIQDVESEEWMINLRKAKKIVGEVKEPITKFDAHLFTELVDKAYIEENGDITFLLKSEIECSVNIR